MALDLSKFTGLKNQAQPQQQPQGPSLFSRFISGAENFGKDLAQPFISGVGSGIRSIEATPALLTGNFNKAENIMKQPMFGEKTYAGMSPKEGLGSAAKMASYIPGLGEAVGAGRAISAGLSGGLFLGGDAALHNRSAGQVVADTLVGFGGAAALDKVISAAFNIFSSPTAEQELQNAFANRENVGKMAASNFNVAVEKINKFSTKIGEDFQKGAEAIKGKSLTLSKDVLSELNDLKDSKSFKLPESIRQDVIHLGNGEVKLSDLNIGKDLKLTPPETQKLLRELNSETYKRMADGSIQVDHRIVDLINQIKIQLIVEKMYGNEATVSADEVNQYISQNKAQMTATDSAGQIKEATDALKQQKLSQIFSTKFQQLKQQAQVQTF